MNLRRFLAGTLVAGFAACVVWPLGCDGEATTPAPSQPGPGALPEESATLPASGSEALVDLFVFLVSCEGRVVGSAEDSARVESGAGATFPLRVVGGTTGRPEFVGLVPDRLEAFTVVYRSVTWGNGEENVDAIPADGRLEVSVPCSSSVRFTVLAPDHVGASCRIEMTDSRAPVTSLGRQEGTIGPDGAWSSAFDGIGVGEFRLLSALGQVRGPPVRFTVDRNGETAFAEVEFREFDFREVDRVIGRAYLDDRSQPLTRERFSLQVFHRGRRQISASLSTDATGRFVLENRNSRPGDEFLFAVPNCALETVDAIEVARRPELEIVFRRLNSSEGPVVTDRRGRAIPFARITNHRVPGVILERRADRDGRTPGGNLKDSSRFHLLYIESRTGECVVPHSPSKSWEGDLRKEIRFDCGPVVTVSTESAKGPVSYWVKTAGGRLRLCPTNDTTVTFRVPMDEIPVVVTATDGKTLGEIQLGSEALADATHPPRIRRLRLISPTPTRVRIIGPDGLPVDDALVTHRPEWVVPPRPEIQDRAGLRVSVATSACERIWTGETFLSRRGTGEYTLRWYDGLTPRLYVLSRRGGAVVDAAHSVFDDGIITLEHEGFVFGRVLSIGDAQPLADVRVTVECSDGAVRTFCTDPEGGFCVFVGGAPPRRMVIASGARQTELGSEVLADRQSFEIRL